MRPNWLLWIGPLPSVVDGPAALLAGAAQLWEQAPGNLSYRFQKGGADAVRGAIAEAAHVVDLELVNNRLVIAALEPRGAIGRHDSLMASICCSPALACMRCSPSLPVQCSAFRPDRCASPVQT